MSVIFVGTVEFSRAALRGLLDAGAPIAAVFTLDSALKNGVSDFAAFDDLLTGKNIPLFQIKNMNSDEVRQTFQKISPDFIYIIGWSRLVRRELLATAKKTSIGLHPTLLPEGRGRAPIPWTILKGLKRSGVSLFHLVDAPDAGDLIRQDAYAIDPEETATTLYQKVCSATYNMVKESYPLLASGRAPRLPQEESKATHWTKRTPEDGRINWDRSAGEIHTLIRAVTHPYPGAYSYINGRKIVIWRGKPVQALTESAAATPGTILAVTAGGAIVKTGNGALALESVQCEGDREKLAGDVLRKGDVLHADV